MAKKRKKKEPEFTEINKVMHGWVRECWTADGKFKESFEFEPESVEWEDEDCNPLEPGVDFNLKDLEKPPTIYQE